MHLHVGNHPGVPAQAQLALANELAQSQSFMVNTSHPGKLAEFRSFLARPVHIQNIDLPEPDADAVTVIRYKASQFDGVLVDDTSLEVAGEEVGVNVRWLLAELPNFVGRRATFRCLVGIHYHAKILIYQGEVPGTIVAPRGNSFGFNPMFLPLGAQQTLGEALPPKYNARYLAVHKLLAGQVDIVGEPLLDWNGPFQQE